MITKLDIFNIIREQIVLSNNDCPLRYAPEHAASLIFEMIEQEEITVEVNSGVATCDDPRVTIIDNDNLEQ